MRDRHSDATIRAELDRMEDYDYRKANERLRAEIARLREALERAEQLATNGDGRCLSCGKWLSAGHKDDCPFAALTDTADDWLEQHDAEVRQAERERCAGIAAKLPAEMPPEEYRVTPAGLEGLVERWEVYQCYHGDRIAAAIREE